MRVAILGASDNPSRYSYKAYNLLKESGHSSFLVNPNHTTLLGQTCHKSLRELKDIDTVTVYVNPNILENVIEDLIVLAPKRVIFNPGSENPLIYESLLEKGIRIEEACTLVLLNTNQF